MSSTRRLGWFGRLRAGLRRARPEVAPARGQQSVRDELASARSIEPAPPAMPDENPLAWLSRMLREEEDAHRVLEAMRGSWGGPHERALLDALLVLARQGGLPEPVRIAGARTLIGRCESGSALELLGDVCSTEGLLLAADLRAEAGQLAHATSLVERLLARDFDAPGARERHDRWLAAMGLSSRPEPAWRDPTLLRPESPSNGLRIVGEVGRGGAGSVYEAIDDSLGRRVALKVYHRPQETRAQLMREAAMAVKLVGTGCVRVFDADPDQGWISMEWLPAGSLKQAMARRDATLLLPIESWLLPLLETVARIHELALVHADLKPANVLFRAPGQPVLTDLGCAQEAGMPSLGGSLGYLSPERLAAAPVSVRDDVYALGRIVEDALEASARAAPEQTLPPASSRWRELARMAMSSQRPADVRALLLAR